jgi:hypothetical protein
LEENKEKSEETVDNCDYREEMLSEKEVASNLGNGWYWDK